MDKENLIWRVPEMGNLELHKATFKTQSFIPHFHEQYAIGVFLKGAQAKFYRGSKHIVTKGAICVLNPGEVHHASAIDQIGWTYRMLYANVFLVKQIASQISDKEQDSPYFPNLVIHDWGLFNMIVNLHLTLECPKVSLLEKESKFQFVIGELILRCADKPPKNYILRSSNKHIKMVKNYLDENYDHDVSLKTLSELTQLSPYYLLRLFKKEVGATPHLYLTQCRINKAKRLLISGDSLTDVAYKTGFVDQSHFTHRFRNIVGVTPGQYYSHNLR